MTYTSLTYFNDDLYLDFDFDERFESRTNFGVDVQRLISVFSQIIVLQVYTVVLCAPFIPPVRHLSKIIFIFTYLRQAQLTYKERKIVASIDSMSIGPHCSILNTYRNT